MVLVGDWFLKKKEKQSKASSRFLFCVILEEALKSRRLEVLQPDLEEVGRFGRSNTASRRFSTRHMEL